MAISKITGSALGKDVIMKDVATADGSSPTLTLQTGDTDIAADDVLGTINFQAPDEGAGTDAILVAAGISAISEGDFSSSNNATSLVFKTGASAAAAEKMRIKSDGIVFIGHDTLHQYDAFGAAILMQIEAAGTAPYAGLGMIQNSNDADVGPLIFGKSRGTSVGSTTIVQDGDLLGRIEFQGMDGNDLETGASIFAAVDGTPGADDMPGRLVFNTTADGGHSASERMRIDQQGTVHIGTTDTHAWNVTFDGRLRIGDRGFFGTTSGSTQMGYNWYWDGSAYKRIDTDFANRYYQNGGEHVWDTAVSGDGDSSITWVERMKITNGGVVELGEVREQTNGADLSVTMVSEDAGFSIACRSATDGHTPYMTFQKTPATSGNYTATGVDDFIGLINFKGVNTSAVANEAARIQVVQSATSSSSVPAIMKFEVGAISNCLQIAPNSSTGGAVSIGTTAVARRCDIRSGSVTTLGVFYQDLSDVSMMQMSHARATGSNNATYIQFQNAAGTEKGTIKVTASATSYNTSSDYRLKENVTYDWDGTTRLKQLKPARFNWIEDDTNTLVDGFLAHEASVAVPESVFNDKDEMKTVTNAVLNSHGNVIDEGVSEADWIAGKTEKTDSEGNAIEPAYESDTSWVASKEVPVYQQIDHSKLVPLLVKTIQELEARITALEA